jgi:predicted nucleotidyltransferase
MENTKNKLSYYNSIFFTKLGNYLDTPMYYFGSIQRNDYFPKYSDIDVDIFTDNENSTISKMQHFLHKEKHQFKKFVYRLEKSKIMVHGYKISYKEKENNLNAEFSIYNEKYKDLILDEHRRKIDLPFYISFFLIILKYFYYDLAILPKYIYIKIKEFLMDTCIDGKKAEFVVIDLPDVENN